MPMYLILLAILSLYKSQPGAHKWYKHWLHASHLTRMAENGKSVAINPSTSKTSNIRCYAHLRHVLGDIRPFKEATCSTYLRCVGIWKDLVGNQADIARCFVRDHRCCMSFRPNTNTRGHATIIIENATIISWILLNKHEQSKRNKKKRPRPLQVGNNSDNI